MRSVPPILLLALLVGCSTEARTTSSASDRADPGFAPTPPCDVGELPDEHGDCAPAEKAVVGAGGRLYWVNQRHPAASDANPGTRDLPWRTIGRATGADVLDAGDAVLVRSGTYRESLRPRAGGRGPGMRVTYAAYPGDTVIVSGADVLPPTWERHGPGWRQPYRRDFRSWPGNHGDVMRRELVVVGETVLRPVYRVDDLIPGTFYAEGPDTNVVRLHLIPADGHRPHEQVIEAAERTWLFAPRDAAGRTRDCGEAGQPEWLRLVGFVFRHANNRAQWGAVCIGGAHGLVEDVTVEWTNGAGFDTSGRNHVFRRNRAMHNGQLGYTGSCTDCLFENNQAGFNNWKGYNPFWEAGGGKWTRTSGSRWVAHYAHDNGGPGLWLDIRNSGNEIIGGYFADNDMAGIMLELATVNTRVENNTVTRTRWLRWTGTGILSQAASGNHIIDNTIVGNEGTGLWIRLDPDRRAPDGENTIERNLVAGNATRDDVEAREVAVEGETIEHVRTNRFRENRYGIQPARVMRSTFFVRPEPGNPAHYRGSDLESWQRLTGAEGDTLVHPDHTRDD